MTGPATLKPTCPSCGAEVTPDAPRGYCVKCLFALGTADPDSVADDSNPQPLTLNSQPAAPLLRSFGDYELLEEIARGGMGVVYKARQKSLDRIVAVKVLLFGGHAGKGLAQRFRTEAAAAASLQHPNIVAIHEVNAHEGQPFFVMDFVEGQSLARLNSECEVRNAEWLRRAARYVKTVAEAIQYAHERGILHRDLKPSNVLIDPFDQPRVTDFGLAKRLHHDSELTLSGQVLGSPNYMPPEQAAAKRGLVGRRSDVYSLGAILYHLLTGRPPFVGETLTDTLQEVLNTEPVSPRLLNPSVPRDLETLCLKCLEKEPARRYQTAQALAEDLERFLRDDPIQARPIGPAEKVWRWCRRKPALASLGASLVAVFMLGFTGTLWQSRKAMNSARAETEQRRLAEQNLYDSDIRLAQRAWDDGDLGLTRGLLQAHLPHPGEPDQRGFEWYYFWNLCRGDQLMTLPGHRQAVTCLAFSPDGKRLATGSVGDAVQIWDCATGTIVTTLPEPSVVSLAFAPDGRLLGVGGRDQVIVWDLETRHVVFKREAVLGRFRIAFLPVGTFLLIGERGRELYFDGGGVELWDYVTEEKKHVFPDSGGHLALAARGDRLATGNWNQTTKIWDLASRQLVRSLETGAVMAMALSPDGQTLATCYWGLEVRLWDVTTGRPIGSLNNKQHRVWSLAFSPDGRSLATGDADQMVRLWDVVTLRPIEQLHGHGNEVVSVAFSPDGRTLASGGKDHQAMRWSVLRTRAVTTVSNVYSLPVFSGDSRFMAADIGQDQVAVWDLATLQVKAVFADARAPLAFSPDGSALITQGTNYFLRTFDVTTQTARETIPGRPVGEAASCVALSPDGQTLVEGLTNGTLTFSDAKTSVVLANIPHEYVQVFQLAFSPNGKLLAMAGREAEADWGRPAAKIFDMATHKMVRALVGHTDRVLSVAFSPDGRALATSSADNSIIFWDTTTWRQIPPSLGHKEYVNFLTFAPNGKTLASVSYDGTMKLWNVATHRELASVRLGSPLGDVTFSPDGQTLAADDGSGLLRLLRAPVTELKRP